mgnify:CR=1 FL=1
MGAVGICSETGLPMARPLLESERHTPRERPRAAAIAIAAAATTIGVGHRGAEGEQIADRPNALALVQAAPPHAPLGRCVHTASGPSWRRLGLPIDQAAARRNSAVGGGAPGWG